MQSKSNATSWLSGLRERWGLTRSLLMYYGIPGRQARMRKFYRQFIAPGDLCFDIGAHVGNRLKAWLALGARAVAVEPQPLLMQSLQRRYGATKEIDLVAQAIGAQPGEATLHISTRTPTVTTMSQEWISQVKKDESFEHVQWDRQVVVQVITLDQLIAEKGEPVFCKIDVEGFELQVLKGLSRPLRALSFEYIPAAISMAIDCIDRLQELGNYEYNLAPGETHRLCYDQWLTAEDMRRQLRTISEGSGDVYARLRSTH